MMPSGAYAKSVTCTDISCLQGQTTDMLQHANQALYQETTPCIGFSPVGPSLDDISIRRLQRKWKCASGRGHPRCRLHLQYKADVRRFSYDHRCLHDGVLFRRPQKIKRTQLRGPCRGSRFSLLYVLRETRRLLAR
jgi:hypothetical protein